MDEATKNLMIDAISAKVDRIVDTLPAELAEQARNMTETDLHREVSSRAVGHMRRLLALLGSALQRCYVCQGAEQPCAHCTAAGMEVMEIAQDGLVLTTITRAATRPGGRIAAQREAEVERKAGEKS